MSLKTTAMAAVMGVVAAGGLALAAVPAANATTLPLPTCSSVDPGTAPNFVNNGHCWYLPQGTGAAAGYLGADDLHTRYRFIQTNFPVSPQLVNLNGMTNQGAAGIEECDPNIGYAAQFGVVLDPSTHVETPFYAEGYWNSTTGDPCINHTPLIPNPTVINCPVNGNGHSVTANPAAWCGSFAPVSVGDQLSDFAIFYTPSGSHFHQTSFGFCDVTQGQCRQAYAPHTVNLNFWEVGAGIFSGAQFVGAPPTLPVVSFTKTSMNCYTCKGGTFRPISVIQPVNNTGTGGLEQVVDVNGSGQVVLGANNSLDSSGNFAMFNGSTS